MNARSLLTSLGVFLIAAGYTLAGWSVPKEVREMFYYVAFAAAHECAPNIVPRKILTDGAFGPDGSPIFSKEIAESLYPRYISGKLDKAIEQTMRDVGCAKIVEALNKGINQRKSNESR